MIYLTEEDILQAASIGEVVDAIEESMLIYERGDFLMPDRMQIDSGDNTMLLMPCFIGIGSYKPADREFPRVLYNLLETIYIDTDTDHALQESATKNRNHLLQIGRHGPVRSLRSKTNLRKGNRQKPRPGDQYAASPQHYFSLSRGLGQKVAP